MPHPPQFVSSEKLRHPWDSAASPPGTPLGSHAPADDTCVPGGAANGAALKPVGSAVQLQLSGADSVHAEFFFGDARVAAGSAVGPTGQRIDTFSATEDQSRGALCARHDNLGGAYSVLANLQVAIATIAASPAVGDVRGEMGTKTVVYVAKDLACRAGRSAPSAGAIAAGPRGIRPDPAAVSPVAAPAPVADPDAEPEPDWPPLRACCPAVACQSPRSPTCGPLSSPSMAPWQVTTSCSPTPTTTSARRGPISMRACRL